MFLLIAQRGLLSCMIEAIMKRQGRAKSQPRYPQNVSGGIACLSHAQNIKDAKLGFKVQKEEEDAAFNFNSCIELSSFGEILTRSWPSQRFLQNLK